jgi:hypothetical protein
VDVNAGEEIVRDPERSSVDRPGDEKAGEPGHALSLDRARSGGHPLPVWTAPMIPARTRFAVAHIDNEAVQHQGSTALRSGSGARAATPSLRGNATALVFPAWPSVIAPTFAGVNDFGR